MQAQADALAQRGEVVVREALIRKLSEIRFTLIPYSRDSAPDRLEHVDARPASFTDHARESAGAAGGDR